MKIVCKAVFKYQVEIVALHFVEISSLIDWICSCRVVSPKELNQLNPNQPELLTQLKPKIGLANQLGRVFAALALSRTMREEIFKKWITTIFSWHLKATLEL